MKKLIGLALLASAAIAGSSSVAQADGFSGAVALTSDYVFRGISQSDGAAIQGSIDYTQGIFYAGAWGSSISFAPMELDGYFGVRPTTGPVSWDLGVVGYFYPNSSDSAGELDYYEGKAAATITPGGGPLTLGAAAYYSPDFTGETGTGWYGELNGSYAFSDAFSVSAAYGHQDVEDIGDYDTWNVGAHYAISGFSLGLTYSDSDAYDNGFIGDKTLADGRVAFSVSRSM
jgi:uncharacterized protein (TIGR02001 family)